jgi:hypothetical protein
MRLKGKIAESGVIPAGELQANTTSAQLRHFSAATMSARMFRGSVAGAASPSPGSIPYLALEPADLL